VEHLESELKRPKVKPQARSEAVNYLLPICEKLCIYW